LQYIFDSNSTIYFEVLGGIFLVKAALQLVFPQHFIIYFRAGDLFRGSGAKKCHIVTQIRSFRGSEINLAWVPLLRFYFDFSCAWPQFENEVLHSLALFSTQDLRHFSSELHLQHL